jgi:acyl-coenzyme A synthetase/AMP-(fatty) acid ligase
MKRVFRPILAQTAFVPEKPAFMLKERFLTYSLVVRAIASAQKAIASLKLSQDKPVGLLVDDPARHMIVSLALMGMGYTVAGLREDLIQPARACGIDVFIVDDRAPRIPDVATYLVGDAWFAARDPGQPIAQEWPDNRAIRIVFTSGSTGRPKPITRTLPFLLEAVADNVKYRIGPSERSICMEGMSASGFARTLAQLMYGKTVCFARLADVLHLAQLYNVRSLTCTHRQLRSLLEMRKQERLSVSFDFIALGCGQLNVAQQSEIRSAFGGQLSSSYASTEFGYAAIATGEVLELRSNIGNCFSTVANVQVVDDNNIPLPAGVEGQIRVHVKHPTWVYSGPLEMSSEQLKEWIYPGDFGFLTPEGMLVLTGRKDEIINDGGVRFDPEAMEVHLRRIVGVTDVAAIKMPVSDGAPQPWLAIVAEGAFSLEEINGWIERSILGELGSVQFARLFQLDSIPITASGKVARQQLREILSSMA